MGDYDYEERRPSNRVEREAHLLKDSLEDGCTRNTISSLQREMQTMCPAEFRAMLNRVQQIDNTDYGDNLRVARDGDIVLNDRWGRDTRVGNIYEQERCWNDRQAELQRQMIPERPVVVERLPARPYYDPDYDRYDRGYRQPTVIVAEPGYDYRPQPRFIPQPRYGVVGNGYYEPGYRDPVANLLQGGIQGAAVAGLSHGDMGRGFVAGAIINQVFRGNGW
jgi:hypothetical protein